MYYRDMEFQLLLIPTAFCMWKTGWGEVFDYLKSGGQD